MHTVRHKQKHGNPPKVTPSVGVGVAVMFGTDDNDEVSAGATCAPNADVLMRVVLVLMTEVVATVAARHV